MRPRFSLRSMLAGMFFFASTLLLWLHWEPWVPVARVSAGVYGDYHWYYRDVTPDGQRAAVASPQMARLWNLRTGRPLREYPAHYAPITDFEVTPAGFLQACAGHDEQTPIPVPAWSEPPEILALKDRLHFPVRQRSAGKTVRQVLKALMDELAKQDLGSFEVAWDEPLSGVPCLWDARYHVPFDLDGEAWIDAFEAAAAQGGFTCRFEPGKITLMPGIVGDDLSHKDLYETVYVWNLERGDLQRKLSGIGDTVRDVRFCCGGRILMARTAEGKVRAWRTGDWSVCQALPAGSAYDLRDCAVSGDGRILAVRDAEGAVTVWDERDALHPRKIPGGARADRVALSPGGTRLLVDRTNEGTSLYEVETLQRLAVWQEFFPEVDDSGRHPRRYEFSTDGKLLLSPHYDGARAIRSADNGEKVALPEVHLEMFNCGAASASADGTRLACRTLDGAFKVWDLRTGEPLATLPRYSSNPDRARLERMIDFWQDIETPKEKPPEEEPVAGIGNPFGPATPSSEAPWEIYTGAKPVYIAPGGDRIAAQDGGWGLVVWERRRPEWWWGVAWLPEFWLTGVFVIVLAWSLRRDRRLLWKRQG